MPISTELTPVLKKLRLSGVLQTLDLRTKEAVDENLGHAEFLFRLCTFRWGPVLGTVAADTSCYPLGTRVHVEGWGWGVGGMNLAQCPPSASSCQRHWKLIVSTLPLVSLQH